MLDNFSQWKVKRNVMSVRKVNTAKMMERMNAWIALRVGSRVKKDKLNAYHAAGLNPRMDTIATCYMLLTKVWINACYAQPDTTQAVATALTEAVSAVVSGQLTSLIGL